MTLIVKEVTRLVTGFIAVYGVYLVLYGHLSPGGGFTGGVVLASGLILMFIAFGSQPARAFVREESAKVWDSLAALSFLFIAILGYFIGKEMFFGNPAGPGNYRLLSGGIIVPCNIAIGLKVGFCLFAVFVALVAFRRAGRKE